jgi:hypothetical protein
MGSGEAVRHTCSTLADIQRQRLPSKHSNATTKFLWDCWTMLPNGFNPSSNSGSALPQHTRNQPLRCRPRLRASWGPADTRFDLDRNIRKAGTVAGIEPL